MSFSSTLPPPTHSRPSLFRKDFNINLPPKHSLPHYFGLPYQNSLCITPIHATHFRLKAVSCRPDVRRLGFNPWAVPVGFGVHKLALEQVSFLVFPFSPVSIISPMLYIHHLHVALTRRTNGLPEKQCSFGNRRNCLKTDFKALIFVQS